jgi:hypothetical protein
MTMKNRVVPKLLIIAGAILLGGNFDSAMADACTDIHAAYDKQAVDNAAGWEEVKKGRKERDAITGENFNRDKYDLADAKQSCAQAQFKLHTDSAHHILGKALLKVCGKRVVLGCKDKCHYWFDKFDASNKEEEKRYCDKYEELKKKAETR